MIDQFYYETVNTNEVLAGFSSNHEPPCLSLYQPTHRRHPENQQDPIRFRNLVRELEASLRQKYPTAETQPLLEHYTKPSGLPLILAASPPPRARRATAQSAA